MQWKPYAIKCLQCGSIVLILSSNMPQTCRIYLHTIKESFTCQANVFDRIYSGSSYWSEDAICFLLCFCCFFFFFFFCFSFVFCMFFHEFRSEFAFDFPWFMSVFKRCFFWCFFVCVLYVVLHLLCFGLLDRAWEKNPKWMTTPQNTFIETKPSQ